MEHTMGRLLFLTHRSVHDELDRRLGAHGASIWQWVLLKEASNAERIEHADGASQRELADLMRIEPPTLVRHLDKLTEEGLVERRPDPTDRRVVRVVVTPAGIERLDELHAVVQELDVELRGILTKRDTEVLERALSRVHAYFGRPADVQERKEAADAH
jgi:DNA-binding MarR family transcriptional regulator